MDCCSPVAEVHAATLTLWAALGVGLTTSLGHCLGMCGPLISTFSLAQGRTDSRLTRLVPGLLLYHLGRLNAYALIGALFGLLMTVTHTEGPSPTIRAAIFGFSGTLMVLMGLGLGGWLPTGHLLQNHRLGQFIAGKFMALAGTSSMAGRYFLGVANGFLPCGPVYAMAAATLTAPTPLHGAGTMAMFGLGTVPVLLAVGLGAGRLAPALQRRFNLAAAILVVFMGLEFLFRAGSWWGWCARSAGASCRCSDRCRGRPDGSPAPFRSRCARNRIISLYYTLRDQLFCKYALIVIEFLTSALPPWPERSQQSASDFALRNDMSRRTDAFARRGNPCQCPARLLLPSSPSSS
ncbi:MAG: sulfite exporter TauE/SafE family protein [bacterium]|nr:sulfite exporter TauE/SafE family protein [bacterium]